MRKPRTNLAIVISAILTTASALAAVHSQHSDSTRDDFSWSDDGSQLNLHSSNDSGLIVGRTVPSPFHGLETGDVITAVGDRNVAHVEDLMQAIGNQCRTSATLHVRRKGSSIALTWKHSECQILAPPPPPPPPPPPARPAPPPPPAPPATHY